MVMRARMWWRFGMTFVAQHMVHVNLSFQFVCHVLCCGVSALGRFSREATFTRGPPLSMFAKKVCRLAISCGMFSHADACAFHFWFCGHHSVIVGCVQ